MFKKKIVFIAFFLWCSALFAEEIDIVGKNNYELPVLRKNETIGYERTKTNGKGFRIDFFGVHNNNKRVLGSFIYCSGFIQICSDNIVYFSVDNYKSNYYSAIYKYDANSGKIIKILDGFTFAASNDGRYICYAEPWQIEEKENHEVKYWYIYDMLTKKQKVIINSKQENNWQIDLRAFDEKTNSFIFELGYDATVLKCISFNPYEILP